MMILHSGYVPKHLHQRVQVVAEAPDAMSNHHIPPSTLGCARSSTDSVYGRDELQERRAVHAGGDRPRRQRPSASLSNRHKVYIGKGRR